jgi:hypothetical protein
LKVLHASSCFLSDVQAGTRERLGIGVLLLAQQVQAECGKPLGVFGGAGASLLLPEVGQLAQQQFSLGRPVHRFIAIN